MADNSATSGRLITFKIQMAKKSLFVSFLCFLFRFHFFVLLFRCHTYFERVKIVYFSHVSSLKLLFEDNFHSNAWYSFHVLEHTPKDMRNNLFRLFYLSLHSSKNVMIFSIHFFIKIIKKNRYTVQLQVKRILSVGGMWAQRILDGI